MHTLHSFVFVNRHMFLCSVKSEIIKQYSLIHIRAIHTCTWDCTSSGTTSHLFLVCKKIRLWWLLQRADYASANTWTWMFVDPFTAWRVENVKFRLAIEIWAFPCAELSNLFLSFVPTPCCLNETSCPCSPLMGVKPQIVSNFLAVEHPKLGCHKLQVVCSEGERLHLSDCLDRSGRGGEDHARPWALQRPREELLTTEVTRA